MQNNFSLGDDDSSSDGESVTLSIHGGAEPQPAEPEPQPAEPEPQPANPQPANPQPAARQSKRAKVPRKIFTL